MEAWFAGAHADVGGGYVDDESALSNHALGWMTSRLRGAGLLIDPFGADVPGSGRDSTFHWPWQEGVWRKLPHVPRALPPQWKVHSSVADILAGPAPYNPSNLAPFLVNGAVPADRFGIPTLNRGPGAPRVERLSTPR